MVSFSRQFAATEKVIETIRRSAFSLLPISRAPQHQRARLKTGQRERRGRILIFRGQKRADQRRIQRTTGQLFPKAAMHGQKTRYIYPSIIILFRTKITIRHH